MSQPPRIAIAAIRRTHRRGTGLVEAAKLVQTVRLLERRVRNAGAGGLENVPGVVVAVEVEQRDELGVQGARVRGGAVEHLVAVLEDLGVVWVGGGERELFEERLEGRGGGGGHCGGGGGGEEGEGRGERRVGDRGGDGGVSLGVATGWSVRHGGFTDPHSLCGGSGERRMLQRMRILRQ